MNELAPYLTSIVCSLFSFLAAVIVCRKNNNAELKKLKEQHNLELEKIRKETESKIEIIQKEYELKAGTDMVTSLVNKTANVILDSPAVKQQINQKTNNSFVSKRNHKRHK